MAPRGTGGARGARHAPRPGGRDCAAPLRERVCAHARIVRRAPSIERWALNVGHGEPSTAQRATNAKHLAPSTERRLTAAATPCDRGDVVGRALARSLLLRVLAARVRRAGARRRRIVREPDLDAPRDQAVDRDARLAAAHAEVAHQVVCVDEVRVALDRIAQRALLLRRRRIARMNARMERMQIRIAFAGEAGDAALDERQRVPGRQVGHVVLVRRRFLLVDPASRKELAEALAIGLDPAVVLQHRVDALDRFVGRFVVDAARIERHAAAQRAAIDVARLVVAHPLFEAAHALADVERVEQREREARLFRRHRGRARRRGREPLRAGDQRRARRDAERVAREFVRGAAHPLAGDFVADIQRQQHVLRVRALRREQRIVVGRELHHLVEVVVELAVAIAREDQPVEPACVAADGGAAERRDVAIAHRRQLPVVAPALVPRCEQRVAVHAGAGRLVREARREPADREAGRDFAVMMGRGRVEQRRERADAVRLGEREARLAAVVGLAGLAFGERCAKIVRGGWKGRGDRRRRGRGGP
ncbi:Uncharacterised protein [Burkholderia pseudomallei]|nr:Uncharacterised protein [Burkholderia pseudomallei]CAJ6481756.1 Uncharacterised protein [Burkholderia pseudomallei]CAJ8499937.1 Uncharacterised protein [Burkholderia pseudomallei]VBS06959.1 Uncharacterised protein [Burkholderia pseudomallei]